MRVVDRRRLRHDGPVRQLTSIVEPPASSGLRRALPLVAWVAALVVGLLGAVALGSTAALAAPPLLEPARLGSWAAARGPVEAAFAVLRIVFVALTCYLLLATLLAVVLRLGRAGRLVTVVDVVTLPWVRRIVQQAVGVGMAGAALAAVGAASAQPAGATPTALVTAAHPALSPPAAEPADDAPAVQRPELEQGPPTMHRLDHPAPAGAAHVVLEPGDHLWSVAERSLAEAWGRAPTDGELVPYWEQLVEVNRAGLPDPANPDLVLPGHVVALPAPPAAP